MDNTIEEIFLSQGWPNDVIEKLKQLFDIRDLEKLSHIHYNTFSNYMRKYPFLDLETAAKIFILNLYNINFNIFEENIQDFINLLKIKDEMFIYQIIKMAENRIPINLILPIATNLDTDDLINFQNFYISFKPYDDSDKFSTLNFKYILPALKNINLDDMKLFSFFLSRNINNLNQAISLYKRLGSNKIFIFLLLKEKMKIDNDEDIKKLIDILSKISNQNANKIKKL